MKKRKNIDFYLNRVAETLGDDYIVTIAKRKSIIRNSRIFIEHCCGYKYETSIASILIGSKCPKCAKNNSIIKRRKTTEQFKKEVYDLVGDEYEVIDEYTGALSKITFKHNKCGKTFEMVATNFLNGISKGKKNKGYRCPICENILKKKRSIERRKTTEQFKKEVYDLVGDEYEVIDEYITAIDKITFKHNKCGNIFKMAPNKFLNNRRCSFCTSKSKAELVITDYLKNKNIPFKCEVWFSDLRDKLPLRYDFAIYYDKDSFILLEYNGDQHFKNVEYFGGNEEFKKRIIHDNMKREYAKNNNIELFEINSNDNIIDSLNLLIDHLKQLKLRGTP